MGDTSIQWTEKTWNPVRGCSVVSPGCHNCYAMKQAHRFSGPGKPYEGLTKQTKAGPQWTGKIATVEDGLYLPLSWRRPQRIFVNSMSDLFHEGIPDEFIDRVFAVMSLAKQHTFQILTKRAGRMRAYLSADGLSKRIAERILAEHTRTLIRRREIMPGNGFSLGGLRVWPLPNVWLGVSAENQRYADERITQLLDTPAAVRFVSAEPLLGPINFKGIGYLHAHGVDYWNAFTGFRGNMGGGHTVDRRIDWVIVGGESGNGARLFDSSHARSIVTQCAEAGVACFVKQLGAKPEEPSPGAWNTAHRQPMVLRDRKGGDMDEWPADLRVRQFPEARA